MSTIRKINWDSWGGPHATGHGMRQAAAMPAPETRNLVAKDLGTTRMSRSSMSTVTLVPVRRLPRPMWCRRLL
ncbi:hypothetical protein [Mycobacterium mantenii]|uniref:hypothetical protein n=1 Tax=Mycobacterium mantenii TaxID=560555 RepID=UPI0021F2840A|nr:hypothetical protein [Mycobacterium mantenii]